MANPIEKDEDQSMEKRTGQLLFSVASFTLKIGKDITEWFEKAFENIKGAFDKHECFVEETFRGRKSKVGDTCHFYEDCIKYHEYNYYTNKVTKKADCELKTWASIIKWLLIVVAVIIVLVGVVYCGFDLD